MDDKSNPQGEERNGAERHSSGPSPADQSSAGQISQEKREKQAAPGYAVASTPKIAESKREKKDNTHWLYIGVIIAVIAGIIFGLVAPDTAKGFKELGTTYVSLIKMIIACLLYTSDAADE